MPLQRYEGGATPFNPTSSTGYQAQAQTIGALTDRLEEWNARAYDVAKQDADYQGRQQAITDITSGDPLKVEKGYSFYAKAYNEVSKAAYNAEVESDLKVKAEELASVSKSDPEQFKQVFGAYVKTTVAGIQEPEFKAIALQAGQKQLGTQYSSLMKEALKNRRENDIKAIDAGIKDLESEYTKAFSRDDYETTSDSLAKITALMESKVRVGEMSEDMIPLEIKRILTSGVKTKIVEQHSNETASGKIGFKQQFLKSKEFADMSIEDRNDVIKRMNENTEAMHKMVYDDIKNNNEMVVAASKMQKEKFLTVIYSGGKFEKEQLDQALASDQITANDYQEVLDNFQALRVGTTVDDKATVLNLTRQLGHLSNEQILRAPITYKTKLDLMSKNMSRIDHISYLEAQNKIMQGFRNQFGSSPQAYANKAIEAAIPSIGTPQRKAKIAEEKWDIFNSSVLEAESKGLSPTSIPDIVNRKLSERKAIKDAEKKTKQEQMQKQKIKDKLNYLRDNAWWGANEITEQDAIEALEEEERQRKEYGKLQ